MEETTAMINAWNKFKLATRDVIKAQRAFARIHGVDLETGDTEKATTSNKKRSEPEPEEKKEDEEFVCAGQIWLEPPEDCIGGDLSKQKECINFQGPDDKKRRRYTICKGCKNARNRWNNKKKREEKKAVQE